MKIKIIIIIPILLLLINVCSCSQTKLEYTKKDTGVVLTWDKIKKNNRSLFYELYVNDSLVAKIYSVSRIDDSNTVWTSENGIIKIEAEDIRPKGWKFANEWKGYSGQGYMINQVSCNTGEEELSLTESAMIPNENQFIIKFRVYEPGYYRMDARWAADDSEANDLWFRFTEEDQAYHKIGRIIREEQRREFLFNAWNLKERYLNTGIYTAFFAPRSVDLCLDYIFIHKVNDESLTDTTDLAKEKYGYWLINAMSENDKTQVVKSKSATIESNKYFIPNSVLNKVERPIQIVLVSKNMENGSTKNSFSITIDGFKDEN